MCPADDREGPIVQRLNIVVPYRAREAHLKFFITHVRAYFARDKIDRDIPYRVLVIEQEEGAPFNRGALKNIGFQLGRDDSDYTCFHDVDYIPIWADYRWSETPVAIVWYGAESRPISMSQPANRVVHDLERFAGGAVLTPNHLFEHVNGYANDYWGWGYEDLDLKKRFQAAGITLGRRKGTFQPLDHDSEGFESDARPTPAALANQQRYAMRWPPGPAIAQPDGLKTLAFEVLNRRRLPEEELVERPALWEMVTVRLKTNPPQTA